MNTGKTLKQATDRLQSTSSTPRLDSLVLLSHCLDRPKAQLLADQGEELTQSQLETFWRLIDQRSDHYPIAYILGSVEFYGRSFIVNPDVLIPRPETEQLVEYCLAQAPENARIVDIGTGSGCIAVTIANQRPDLDVTAGDISESALVVAAQNIAKHEARVLLRHSNLLKAMTGKFNIIIANLPYVPEPLPCSPDTKHEPALALFSEKDGLNHYHKLLFEAGDYLLPNGILILEAFPRQRRQLTIYAEKTGFRLLFSQDFCHVFTN